MSKQPVTRRVINAQKMAATASNGPRTARCGIRVSETGERKKRTAGDSGNSIDSRARDFLSPESQSNVAAAYCAEKGIPYDEEASLRLRDIDVRARKEGSWRSRRGLMQHLADAEANLFTDIVFYKLSRLARNVRDGLEIVEAFMKAGVTVHFARDTGIPPLDTATGQLFLMISLWIAQAEADNIGDNVSDAVAQKWREGKPHGNKHGWLRGDKAWEDHRRLVELAMEGRSYIEIARILNQEERLTPRGKLWESSSISDRLKPDSIKKMLGTAISGDMGNGKVIEIPKAWKPLISEEEAGVLLMLYDTLPARRTTKLERPGMRNRVPYSRHLLSGVARCSVCGKHLVAGSGKGQDKIIYSSYLCQQGKYGNSLHAESGQSFISTKVAALDAAVLNAIRHELTLPPPAPSNISPKKKPAKQERTVEAIDREMEDLLEGRTGLSMSLVVRLLKSLEDEKEELLKEMPAPIPDVVVEKALEMAEDEQAEYRTMVRALVADVIFPLPMPFGGQKVKGHEHARGAKVVMKNGREYLSPIYRLDYKGERVLIPVAPASGPNTP